MSLSFCLIQSQFQTLSSKIKKKKNEERNAMQSILFHSAEVKSTPRQNKDKTERQISLLPFSIERYTQIVGYKENEYEQTPLQLIQIE